MGDYVEVKGNTEGHGNEIIGAPQASEKCTVNFLGKNGRLVIHEGVQLLTVNIYIYDDAVIELGASTKYRGSLRAYPGCRITIGQRLHCNGFLNISCAEETSVTIGDGCLVSEATIRPSDMHPVYDRNTGERINFGADISIGDEVWLGQECLILKGVTIGKGSLIAARAVVTKDIPEHSVAAGNPAKVVRQNIRWGGELPLRPRSEGFLPK